jgi:acyl carrier protein
MTREQATAVLLEELRKIAPEADPRSLRPASNLREELDLDSMDFLNLVTALHERLGIPIPEIDYPSLFTFGGAVDYLAEKVAGTPGAGAVAPKANGHAT